MLQYSVLQRMPMEIYNNVQNYYQGNYALLCSIILV